VLVGWLRVGVPPPLSLFPSSSLSLSLSLSLSPSLKCYSNNVRACSPSLRLLRKRFSHFTCTCYLRVCASLLLARFPLLPPTPGVPRVQKRLRPGRPRATNLGPSADPHRRPAEVQGERDSREGERRGVYERERGRAALPRQLATPESVSSFRCVFLAFVRASRKRRAGALSGVAHTRTTRVF